MSIKRLVPLNTVSLTADPSNAVAGDIYYNSGSSQLRYFNGTSWVILAGSVNALVDAKSIYQDVRNQSGTNMALATPVYVSGGIGASNKILISTASNASEASSSKTMGITTSAISNNSNGQVISEGLLEGIDTTGAADGDPVWLGVDGAKIYGLLNKPSAPAHLVFLGIVIRGGSANTGSMYVKIQNGFELQEIHNVELSSLINGNVLAYDSTTSTWKNTNTLQSTASTVPLVIKGAVSQTANTFEVQNSNGAAQVYVNSFGQLVAVASGIYVNSGYSGGVGAVIRGYSSQTANLQEWQNSSGTVLTSVDKDGYLQTPRLVITNGGNIIDSAGTTPYFGFGSNQIIIYARNAAYKPLVIQGAASQTANLQEWQTSTGSILGKLDKDGKLTTIDIESGALNATWRVYSTAGAPTVVPITAKGAASQTAKLQEWQNSAGTVVASTSVEGNGYFQANLNAASIGAGNNIGGASLTASPWSAATVVSIIRGYTSQSSDLTQWQNSTGTVLTKITSDGSINTSGASGIYSTYGFSSAGGLSIGNGVTSIYVHSTYGMGIRSASGNVSDPTLVIKLGSINQTGSLQEWHNSTGTVLANVSSAGRINAPQFGSTQSGKAYVNTGTSADNNSWTFVTNSASNKGIVVVGAASQSANLQEWQNNSGTILNSISASGTLNINTSGTGTINLGDGVLAKGPGNGFTFNSDIIVLDGKGIEASSGKFTNVTGISTVPLIAKAISGQTANIQEWQNNSGQVRAKIDSYGGFSSLATTQIGNDLNGSGTSLIVYTKDAAGIPIVIKGFTSQAADLQQWQNSAGTVLSSLRKDGTFAGPYLDGLSADGSYIQFVAGAYVDIVGRVINQPTFRVKSVASQTADIQQWQNSSNTVLAKIAASGQIYNDVSGAEPIVIKSAGSTRFELNQYSQGWSNTTFTFGSYYNTDSGTLPRLSVFSGTADTKGLIVRGFTSQSANLQEWQNISGTVLASISSSGGFTVPSLTVSGDFTVNGTTTNINTTNLVVEDKNITIADVSTPTDTTADGAGITIKGATDKTLNWVQSTGSFTSSEPFIINTTSTTKQNLIIKAIASQTSNLIEWQNSSGTTLGFINAEGSIQSANRIISPGDFEARGNSFYGNAAFSGATVNITTRATTQAGAIIRGVASQTANLTEWQDSTGYLISRVDSGGSHWINASPATSGSVETSSAYLYLTSNRWTGSASSAEVFGINNFRFGGAGAVGAFALHLKPASSANAYLSIAGDSSRSVGVNVQYPSASSGYGQFGVQIQDASYKGIVVRAATSQSANLQEWQNSSGGVDTAVTSTGRLSVRTTLADAGLNVGTPSASTVGQIIRGAASQTANLQQWQDSAGSLVAWMGFDGRTYLAYSMIGTWNLDAMQTIYSNSASRIGSVIRSAASSTVNLQEWQDSSGAANTFIDQNQHIFTSSGRAVFLNTGYIASTSFASSAFAPSRIAIIAKAAASQTANIQEWQNSSGTVLSAIDASGSFTSVSQPIQVAGSTYGFTQVVATQYGATAYWKIATLPPTTLSTCDQINIEAMLGGWLSTGKTKYEIMMGNRDTFAYKYTKFGDGLTQARVQAYTEADGSVSVYLYSENTYTNLSYNITLSAVTGSSGVGATIYKNPAASTTAPTGTKSFDTGEPATYIPLMNMTNAGLLSTKSAIFNPTSASAVPLISQGATSQTADLQQWKNSAGTTYLNVTNAGAVISNGGVTISSNPTINAYGAAMKIASGVNSYPMLIIQGATSQTADLQQWQDSAASVIARITPAGGITVSSNITQSSSGRTFIGGAADYGAFLNVGIPTASRQGIVVRANASQTANLEEWQNNAGTVLAKVDATGNFSAISKSFDIPHPTKENMRLRYASLEGNEHGVYVRGITKDKVIELPDYWLKLVDKNSITVHLTPIGKPSRIYVKKIEDNKVYLGGRLKEAAYIIHAERKDIDKLTVEY